jgi:hypothetical protein
LTRLRSSSYAPVELAKLIDAGALFEEGNFSIFAEGGKQWRFKSRNEVLQWIAFRCNVQL